MECMVLIYYSQNFYYYIYILYINFGVSNNVMPWVTGRKSFNNKYECAIANPIKS